MRARTRGAILFLTMAVLWYVLGFVTALSAKGTWVDTVIIIGEMSIASGFLVAFLVKIGFAR